MGKTRWCVLAAFLALCAGSGCCRLCHRWCDPPQSHYPQQHCVPQPVCVPACPPGTTPSFSGPISQGGWQRGPYAQPANGCCYP
jgi:hypothetical protein